MATIGLDKLYYAVITEDANGNETYGSPRVLAKAMNANITVNVDEATLYADDGAAENVKEFKDGTISLGVDNIGTQTAADLCGVTVDANGVVTSTDNDAQKYVAVGFRAKKANKKYRYFWLYRVLFKAPGIELNTKGDSISFSTPTIEGTFYRRNKVIAGTDNHPYKSEVTEGDAGVTQTVIDEWFDSVYEPGVEAADATLSALSIANATLSPAFNANVTAYTATVSSASAAVTATATAGTAKVAITVNGASIASGGSGSFVTGKNDVRVTVTNGSSVKTYVITVTK